MNGIGMFLRQPVLLLVISLNYFIAPILSEGNISLAFSEHLANTICNQFKEHQGSKGIPEPVKFKPAGTQVCITFQFTRCNHKVSCHPFQQLNCDGTNTTNEKARLDTIVSPPAKSGPKFKKPPKATVKPDGGGDDGGKKKSAVRIVGGAKSKKYKYPALVLIKVRNVAACGGTIISQEWILTAAHCLVDDKKPQHYSFVAAEYDKDDNEGKEQFAQAVQLILHEKYDEETQENDIAMVKISPPFVFNSEVKAVVLPKKDHEPQGNMWVAGWGRLEDDGDVPDIRKEDSLPIVDLQTCKKRLEDYLVTEKQLCAGFDYGGVKDTCQGDSGGPLFDTSNGKDQIIVGIVSWGIGCSQKGMPGVYTRVTSYLDWIAKTMKGGRSIGARKNSIRELVGVQAPPYSYPSIVLIKANGEHICAGTIIDTEWVLTAAHCLISTDLNVYQVVAGEHNQLQNEGPEQAFITQQIFPHTHYNPTIQENDIALVKISPPVTFGGRKIQKALLPNLEYEPKSHVISVGWGKLKHQGGISPILQETIVEPIHPLSCADWLNVPKLYKEKVICTIFNDTSQDRCQGEAGAPLYSAKGGHHYIVGVSSWGETCAKPNNPRVYTKVAHYLPWIQATLRAPDFARNAIAAQGRAPAKKGAYKSVAILKEDGLHTCGATVLNQNWVLTAAHCIQSKKPSSFVVVAGAYDKRHKNRYQQTVMVSKIIIHENYTSETEDDDIAILRVNPPLQFNDMIQHPIFPTRIYHIQDDVTVVGWGTNNLKGVTPHRMQAGELKLIPNEKCSLNSKDPSKLLCVGSRGYSYHPCLGDSGGPIFNVRTTDSGEQQVLVGIAKSRNCIMNSSPAPYTKFYSYLPWILLKFQHFTDELQGTLRFEGENIQHREYISIAVISVKGQPKCLGAILSPEWVLTTSSCAIKSPISTFLVKSGVREITLGGHDWEQSSEIQAVYDKANSNDVGGSSNIALLKLSRPFRFDYTVGSANTSKEGDKHADEFYSIAWGLDWGRSHHIIGQKIKLIKSPGCKETNPASVCLKNTMGGKGLCVGDRGSPIFTSDGELYGILSSDDTCKDGGSSVTKVSALSSWISQTIEASTNGIKDTTIEVKPKDL